MSEFVTVANTVLNRDEVACLIQDPSGEHKVTVWLTTGEHIDFTGHEAAEVWKAFDKDNRDDYPH